MNFSSFWGSKSTEKDKSNYNNNNSNNVRKPSVIPPPNNNQLSLQSPFNKTTVPIRSSVKRPRDIQSNVSVNQIANVFNNVSNIQPNKPKLYAPSNTNNNSIITTNHPDLFIGNNLSKGKTSSSSSSNNNKKSNNYDIKNVFLSSLVGDIEYSSEMEKVDDVLKILFKDDEEFMNKLHDFSIQMEGLVSVGDGEFWKSSSSGYESLIDTVKKFTERKFFPKTLSEPYVRSLSVDEQIYLGNTIRDEIIKSFDGLKKGEKKVYFASKNSNINTDRWVRDVFEETILEINKDQGIEIQSTTTQQPQQKLLSSSSSSNSSNSSSKQTPQSQTPVISKSRKIASFGKKNQIIIDRNGLENISEDIIDIVTVWSVANIGQEAEIVYKAFNDGKLYTTGGKLISTSRQFANIFAGKKQRNVVVLSGPTQKQQIALGIQNPIPPIKFSISVRDITKNSPKDEEYVILKEQIDARLDQSFADPKKKLFKLQIYDSKLKPPKIISLLEQYKNFTHSKKKAAILKDLSFSTDENILLTHLVQSQFVSAIKGGLLRAKYFSTLKEILGEKPMVVTAFAELCASVYRFNAANSSRLTATTRNTQIALALGDQIDMFNNITSNASFSQLSNSPFYQLDNNDNPLLLPGQSRITKRRRLLGFSDNNANNSSPQMIL